MDIRATTPYPKRVVVIGCISQMVVRHAVMIVTQSRTHLQTFVVVVSSSLTSPLTSAAMATTDKSLMAMFVALPSSQPLLGWVMLAVVMYHIISMGVRYAFVEACLTSILHWRDNVVVVKLYLSEKSAAVVKLKELPMSMIERNHAVEPNTLSLTTLCVVTIL